ncbi:MAG: hypothetical protein R6V85_10870 [Polyangia bacterium]
MRFWIVLAMTMALAAGGCGSSDDSEPGDGGTDGDTDADTDGDTDADTDNDADTDTDTHTDTDTDADPATDTDTDTDTDTGTGTGYDEWGECDDSSDCPDGDCVRVPDEPGGWWTCVSAPPDPVEGPSPNPESDLCSDETDCAEGCDCYRVQEMYAGFIHPHNECFCDECDQAADCEDPEQQICAPAGAWGFPEDHCVYTGCKVDADCDIVSGGHCIPYLDACSALEPGPFAGKHCWYPGDCAGHDDCTQEYQACLPDFGDETGFSCQDLMCPGK